jgi:hypothetical protein
MNLLYIRAAIQQATGIILTQEEILRLLVEEGMVAPERASDPDLIFRGYEEFFRTDDASTFQRRGEDFLDNVREAE